jgi:hypothetical protein
MYGLKPVPFKLKPVPFKWGPGNMYGLKPVPFRLEPASFIHMASIADRRRARLDGKRLKT